MEWSRSALHSQRSAPERDAFLYLALGAVSVALSLLDRLSDDLEADARTAPPADGPPAAEPPRGLLR
jgi:hypothetical protein